MIDLKDGLVVAARQGQRHLYQPVATPLCLEPELAAVTRSYLSVFPFQTFYLADLNAIAGAGNNHHLIAQMLATWPDLNLWIDSGLQPFAVPHRATSARRVRHVLGTETGLTFEQLEYYTRESDCILSLDYHGRELLGSPELLEQPARLPQRVIIMSLQRVGSHAGPDLEHVRSLADRLPGKQVYAAGGVRNPEDLRQLAARGVHGALLATALHDKTITSEHLQ